MGGDTPKVLLPVSPGVTVIDVLLEQLRGLVDDIHVVVAPGVDVLVQDHFIGFSESTDVQRKPTGMGDAIFDCHKVWQHHDVLLVVWGDQINLSRETVRRCLDVVKHADQHTVVIPLVHQEHPYVDYIFVGDQLDHVAQRREGDRVRSAGLSDVGLFALTVDGLVEAWTHYQDTAELGSGTGEVNFLPFLAHLVAVQGWSCRRIYVDDPDEARGLNTPDDLVFARRRLAPLAGTLHILCTQAPPPIKGGLSTYLQRLTMEFGLLDPLPVCHSLSGVEVEEQLPIRVRRYSGWRMLHRSGCRQNRLQNSALWGLRLLGYNLRCVVEVLAARRAEPLAVVAVHDWMTCPAGILLSMVWRIPVVLHLHSAETDLYSPHRMALVTGGLEWFMSRLAKTVIVPSKTMAEQMIKKHMRTDRIIVIAHGADDVVQVPVEDPIPPPKWRRDDGPLLVFAGRYRPHKGVKEFVEAVAILSRQHHGLRAVMLGTGSDAVNEELAELSYRLGLEDVLWHSREFVSEAQVYAWIRVADVCVLPSRYEPFGLIGVESMRLGTPTVVGSGYSPEVAGVEVGASIQLDRVTPGKIVEAVNRVLTDEHLRQRLRNQGPQHASHFRWRTTVAQTLRTYAAASRRKR